jgi:hypothetical protein
MALPMPQRDGFQGSPASDPSQRDVLAASRRAQNAKRRAADDARRPANQRRQSLRRVKDSREALRTSTTRARGVSNATIESSTTSTTAGRSFTVANINNGIIYLRYVQHSYPYGRGEWSLASRDVSDGLSWGVGIGQEQSGCDDSKTFRRNTVEPTMSGSATLRCQPSRMAFAVNDISISI